MVIQEDFDDLETTIKCRMSYAFINAAIFPHCLCLGKSVADSEMRPSQSGLETGLRCRLLGESASAIRCPATDP